MTRDELIVKLQDLKRKQLSRHSVSGYSNTEDIDAEHLAADEALIEFIGDEEIGDLFESLERYPEDSLGWYDC
jgi:hypothetical protein